MLTNPGKLKSEQQHTQFQKENIQKVKMVHHAKKEQVATTEKVGHAKKGDKAHAAPVSKEGKKDAVNGRPSADEGGAVNPNLSKKDVKLLAKLHAKAEYAESHDDYTEADKIREQMKDINDRASAKADKKLAKA